MTKVAVVILSWNGEQMLRRFLPSVVKHSAGSDVDVIVTDNGSSDGSCALLEKEFPNVRLIRLDKNYGFAEGYNKALHEVKAEYYVLLNSDVEVTPHWLDVMTAYMDGHPDVAACQPKLLSERQRDTFEYAGAAGGFTDRYGYPFCRGRVFETVERDNGQYDTVCQVHWATGAALMIRAALYHEVGGLDGRFFAHQEEIDLCWRLGCRGFKIMCLPESKVYHVGAATLKKENPMKTYLNFRNNRLMLYKNLPDSELRHVMRVRDVLDVVAAFSFLLKGNAAGFRAVFRALRDYRSLRKDYEPVRKDNLSKAVTASPFGRLPFLLLWQCKAKGRTRYSEIIKSVQSGIV